MKEPIILGLGAEASDEDLEARAAGIRERLDAFINDLTALSRRHNVWVEASEEIPQLVDGHTSERAATCDRDGERYGIGFYDHVFSPVASRRREVARRERWLHDEAEFQRQCAARQQQQVEEETKRAAEGWRRVEYHFHTPGSNALGSNVPPGAELDSGGTVGTWWRMPRDYAVPPGTVTPEGRAVAETLIRQAALVADTPNCSDTTCTHDRVCNNCCHLLRYNVYGPVCDFGKQSTPSLRFESCSKWAAKP